ncbi:MAG: alpha/beta hydrolase, partial [Bacteroidota bacterium]
MKHSKIFVAIAWLFACSAAFSQNPNSAKMQKQINSNTIIFIHGLFMNNQTWNEWKTFFEQEGYTCYAPAHPKHEGIPVDLRANPPKGLGSVQLQDWIANLEALIDDLPEKPILIGHSFGGLTAQKARFKGDVSARGRTADENGCFCPARCYEFLSSQAS